MRRRHVCTASLTAAAVLATSLHAANAPQAAAAATPPTVSYAYDRAGRLTTVTDPTGASATYSYDPVGNLTGITRAAAPHASLADAAPPKPAITTVDRAAASVTVHGTNFSALDTVR
ncbi:MAG TPA: RHS repeat domain-containing protein, partial [Rugosimonospora sp.]|nr:RHS repeat domain-containing protein [Rugosimonospora sp.]